MIANISEHKPMSSQNYPQFEEVLEKFAKRIDRLTAQIKKTKPKIERAHLLGQAKANRQCYGELRAALTSFEP